MKKIFTFLFFVSFLLPLQAQDCPTGNGGGNAAHSISNGNFVIDYQSDALGMANFNAIETITINGTTGGPTVNSTVSKGNLNNSTPYRLLTTGGVLFSNGAGAFTGTITFNYTAASGFSGIVCSFSTGTNTSQALPVNLTAFESEKKNNSVFLSWITKSELNNDYFAIEHSFNGNTFNLIGKVHGHGTTNEVQNYQFIHDHPANGTNYYRLKQMDFNGKFEYSNIEAVHFENGQNMPVQIYPNPVKDGALTVVLDAYNDNKIQIQVYDLTGRIWLQQTSFDATTNLNVNDLPAGIYMIEIAANGQTTRQKVVME